MSTYLGNESLSPAVKERVLSTFQQTLALYKQGRTEEVVAGCGLILRMDPQFDPARKLLDKSRNPQLPIDVDTLGPAAPAPGAFDPLADARRALASRDFQRAINITTEILTNDLMNDDARILNEQAREKMEAGPFVEQFARKCEQHLANKNLAAARTDMEKARALDPDHPALKRIEQMLAGGAAQAAAPASSYSFDSPSPSFVVDTPKPAPTGRNTAQAADFGFTFEEEKPAAAPPPSSFGGGGFSFDSPAAPPPAPAPPPRPAAPPANDAPFGGSFSFDSPSAPPPSGGDALSNFSFESPKPAAPSPAAPSSGFSFDAPAAPSSGFSFDSPSSFSAPAPAPSPAADGPRTFDFATAPTEMSADDQKKIDQYLGEGDHAAEIGDYQKAIDLWSRIFLIDVTNEHASERIERAKVKRREIESRVETIVAAATAALERNDTDTARSKFLEALRVDPGNTAAQEGLERVSGTALEGGASGFEAPFTPPSSKNDLFDDDLSTPYDDVLTPPEPAAPAPAPAKGKATGKTKAAPATSAAPKRSSMMLIATVLAVVVLAGGGYFAYTKFFAKPAFDPAATQATFTQAEQLAKKGKFDQAIGILQDVKLEDPMHDKAVLMISDLQHRKQQASEMIDGKPAAVYYQENLANGKTAYDTHDYEGAKKAWDLATRVKPLSPEMQALYTSAAQQAAKLDSAKALFKEGKYQDAILNLEPLFQQDPQNQNIQRMISDAHFNLGATALGEERLPDAMTQFEEVLKANPNDELAKRSRDLAARYNAQPKGTPKDLLYKIYVKYLPVRKVS
jgi:tetratricopeptide (TPR) repeat protein